MVCGVYNLSAPSKESKTAHKYTSCTSRKIQLLCPFHMQHRNKKIDFLDSNEKETFNAEEVQVICSTKKRLGDNYRPLEGIIGVEELYILHNKCLPLTQACLRAMLYCMCTV